MKKVLLLFSSLLLFVLAFSSCEGFVPTGDHEHVYENFTTVKPAGCLEDGLEEGECECGEKLQRSIPKIGTHTYGDWSDSTADCTNAGKSQRTCSVCSTIEERVDSPLGHDMTDASCQAPSTCTRCGKTEGDVKHNIITHLPMESTCTIKGYSLYESCESCDYERKIELPLADHSLGDWQDGIEPTHTTSGMLGHYFCSECKGYFDKDNEALVTVILPALSHDMGEWINEIPADCENDGTLGHYYCTECSKSYDKDYSLIEDLTIAKTGHTAGTFVAEVAPGCETDGSIAHYLCVDCEKTVDADGNLFSDITTPKTGHTAGTFVAEVAPTCETDGSIAHYLCTDCKKTVDADGNLIPDVTIQRLGHSISYAAGKDSTCKESGYEAYEYCTVCSYSTKKPLPLSDHNYNGVACTACGAFKPSEGLVYELDGDSYALVSTEGCNDDFMVIADSINGIPVRSIKAAALHDNIKSLLIPSSITAIDYLASGCNFNYPAVYFTGKISDWIAIQTVQPYSMNMVFYSETVPTVYDKFFYVHNGEIVIWEEYDLKPTENLNYSYDPTTNTSSVYGMGSCTDSHIVIASEYKGAPVTTVGGFKDKNLYSVVIPDTVTEISNSAFSMDMRLKYLILGSGLKKIGSQAFYYCTRLSNVVLPDSVTDIGDYAFRSSGLRSVTIPGKLINFGGMVFAGAPLRSVTIPSGLEKIFTAMFEGCNQLTEIIIEEGVKEIGINAFSTVPAKSIILPESLEVIGNGAFRDSGLESIVIPKSVKSIGEQAFLRCEDLREATILAPITSLSNELFSGCTALYEFNLPDTVTSIGDRTFNGCTDLNSVTLSSILETIGISAFESCHSLKEISLPHTTYQIGEKAFFATGIKCFEIHNELISIGDGAISGCSLLSEIVISDSHEYYKLIDGGLYTKNGDTLLYYPTIKTDEHFTVPESVKRLGKYSFYDANLKSVTLSSSLEQISNYAFYYAGKLEAIVIPNTVTSIGYGVFSDCDNLESVMLSSSITEISPSTFFSCDKLTSITIPDGVTTIGKGAFMNCHALAEVNLPSTLTIINESAFENCKALKFIALSDGQIRIYERCFAYSGLTAIVIPASLKYVNEAAFISCSLETIYYKGNETGWKSISIKSSNGKFSKSRLSYYSESAPETEGKFWHYVDGIPTPW